MDISRLVVMVGYMPRKKKFRPVNSLMSAHMNEQVEAASRQFLSVLSTYGTQGAICVMLPDGTQAVYVCSAEETIDSHKKILRQCVQLMSIGEKLDIDNLDVQD